MEYNLQKTIEPSFMSPVMGHLGQRLSATPATDYVNPGIGGEINQYSFLVPLHSTKQEHSIEKVIDQDQIGLGNNSDDINK
jgi:hypothetical protein